jgi:hypothetical protein
MREIVLAATEADQEDDSLPAGWQVPAAQAPS